MLKIKHAGRLTKKIKQLMYPTDFHSIFFSYHGSQWGPSTVWLPTFFEISSFVFNRKKEIYTVLKQLDGE